MPKRINPPDKICVTCGNAFNRHVSTKGRLEDMKDFAIRKFCSSKCFTRHNSGSNHWLWRGGVKRRPDGYLRDSKTDQYVHRLVVEAHIGRPLTPEEHVHHIDGNKANNTPTNLLVVSNSEHRKIECAVAKRDKLGRFSIDKS